MNIGIDIDGVIWDWENSINTYAELYDLLELKGKGKVNTAFKVFDKYNWTQKEEEIFLKKYFSKASEECAFLPGVFDVIDELYKRGHNLVIISARGQKGLEFMKDIFLKRFEAKKSKFSKIIFGVKNKLEMCQKEKIDIMIEDNPDISKTLSDSKIKVIYLRAKASAVLEKSEYLKEVNNWGEVLRYLITLENII